MQETIERAKADFLRAKGTLENSFANTRDDRINWSPSPTSRTPIQQVAHAAFAVRSMFRQWSGIPFELATTQEAEALFRDWERQFTTREEVLAVLEANGNAYFAWLNSLTPEDLAVEVKLPYRLGKIPAGVGIEFMPQHLVWHAAQIDYIQTIYGDLEWNLPTEREPYVADDELIVSRTVDAPREMVWRAYTEADQVDQWWGPNGFTNETHSMNVSIGGLWHYTMHGPDGKDWPNWIRYTEIVPFFLLAYDHGAELGGPAHFKVVQTFTERDGKTEVKLRMTLPSKEARDEAVQHGALEGGEQTLNRLAEYVAKR
ncbi:MAG: SRPBCC domain-containing protein [Fimbriimonas sp.]